MKTISSVLLLMSLCISVQARELVIKEPSAPYQFMPYGNEVDGDKRSILIDRITPSTGVTERIALDLDCKNRSKNTNPRVFTYVRVKQLPYSVVNEYTWSTKMVSDVTNIVLGSKFNKYVYKGCDRTSNKIDAETCRMLGISHNCEGEEERKEAEKKRMDETRERCMKSYNSASCPPLFDPALRGDLRASCRASYNPEICPPEFDPSSPEYGKQNQEDMGRQLGEALGKDIGNAIGNALFGKFR